ncbi:MAG: DUF5723 family protein [Prevotellaceae bacterium]|jgi:hypothetical protein|nr:DUF5723 family protein [Prevotellaceae bacterium]
MKYFILSIACLLVATSVKVQAQLNSTLYHMKDLPLNSQLNPAFQPRNGSLYVGFPGLTSFSPSLALSGEGLTLGNAYLNPSYGAIVRGAGDFSMATFDYEHSLINVGFMLKNMYLTFDSKLKLNVEGRIPKDLERLIWYGNGDKEMLGKTLSLEGLGVSALGYGEIALGISVEVAKNAFVGVKAKYLQGVAYMNVGFGDGSSFKTDSATYNITVGLNPDIYLAGLPVTVPQGAFAIDQLTEAGFGAYKFNTGNRGVAFDLGGTWDLPWVKGLNVSASALDLGFISWSGYRIAPENPNSKILFDGISLNAGSDFASGLLDSVKQKTSVTSTSGSRERRWLSPTIYAGATYELHKYFNVGMLAGYRFSQYESSPLVALSANTQGFMVNASVAYSYYNRHSNVGVGLLFGRKMVQWHIIADNILSAVSYKTAQNANLRVGLNFLFGKSRAARRPVAVDDALAPDYEPADTAAGAAQIFSAEADTAAAVHDFAANLRYRQDSVAAPDTVKSVKKATKRKRSREELLRQAVWEENEDGVGVKVQKKVKKKAQKSVNPSEAQNRPKETLLQRAMREEAEDEAKARKKNK